MFELIDRFTTLRPTAPHDIEIIALSHITAALENAIAATDEDAGANRRNTTLYWATMDNTRLWIAFRHDLLDEANRLSDSLKTGLDRVARTAIRHGSRVAAGQASPQLLIDINRAIIAGLDCSRRQLRSRGIVR